MGAGASLDDANTGVNRLEEDTLALKCSAENAVGKKDFTAAELFYTKAIVKAPGAAQLWGGRAGMRNEIGEFGQALNDALNAIELAPVCIKALIHLCGPNLFLFLHHNSEHLSMRSI